MAVKGNPGGFPQRKLKDTPTVTPGQMREIQRAAQVVFHFDILQAVENAGLATAQLVLAMLGGSAKGQRVVVLAGGGHVGAAGLSAVRHLDNWGVQAEPLLGEVESQMSFVTRRHLHILAESGIAEPHDSDTSEHTAEDHLQRADLVVDALVGYGLEGAPTGLAAAVTQIAAAARRPILALDIPTGVNAETGVVSSPAVTAATTLVFDLPKTGQVLPVCQKHVGELYAADLGVPRAAYERLGISTRGVFAEGHIVRLRR